MVDPKDVAQSTQTPREVHENHCSMGGHYTSSGVDRRQSDASGAASDMGPDGTGPL